MFDPWVGNTLQCSCLENPLDRETRWSAGHGVTVKHDRSDLTHTQKWDTWEETESFPVDWLGGQTRRLSAECLSGLSLVEKATTPAHARLGFPGLRWFVRFLSTQHLP